MDVDYEIMSLKERIETIRQRLHSNAVHEPGSITAELMLKVIEEQQSMIETLQDKVEYLTYNVVYNDQDNND